MDDLGRQITCLFFSLWKITFIIRNICVDFLLKLMLFTEEEIQFLLILELSNEGFTFHGDFSVTKSC